MWIIWRLLPLCAVGIALWRILPAAGIGVKTLKNQQAETMMTAAGVANSLQGELGEAMSAGGGEMGERRSRLDGWDLNERRKKKDSVEVVSCGADGECGTDDDVIEIVKADGRRVRIDAK